jgi:hypothetical protein
MNIQAILKDLEATNPNFFEQYEYLAQAYYSSFKGLGVTNGIPKAHANAMLTLLDESGYTVIKKSVGSGGDNVITLRRTV